jgi:hypothetical protein
MTARDIIAQIEHDGHVGMTAANQYQMSSHFIPLSEHLLGGFIIFTIKSLPTNNQLTPPGQSNTKTDYGR